MSMKTKGVSAFAIISSLVALQAQAAAAQDVDTPSAPAAREDGAGIGEIIVTGQRRASTVQDSAATISVLSADALEATGTNSSMSLQFATPGVTISQDLGLQTQIYIRGIGSNLQGIATGNSVATYVDGVYIPNSIQSARLPRFFSGSA